MNNQNEAIKILWQDAITVAKMAPNTGMVVVDSRVILTINEEMNRLREIAHGAGRNKVACGTRTLRRNATTEQN